MSVTTANTNASLSTKTITVNENADTITGLKTFDRDPAAPFAVTASSAVVTNLDADKLDGLHGSSYSLYSDGTWTPTLTSTGGGTPTYAATTGGIWVKNGKLVFAQGIITLSNFGTLGAGNLSYTNLPFTSDNNGLNFTTVLISYYLTLTTTVSSMGGLLNPNTTAIAAYYVPAAGGTGTVPLTKADISPTSQIAFSITYKAIS